MYESFFNLRKKPFELVPDPDFIFLSKSHKKALTFLDHGIMERAGFILLTGEVGSGKTTLIRDLLNKHYERVVLAKIFNTRVTSEQLLAMINDDFGLATQGKDKVSLIRDLNGFLVEQYASGNQPILIIDEAQNLAPELLEEVRMLSNLETSDSKLLQIILVGQPELRTILAAPELLQLRQRININCHLKALSWQETEQYITHRMDVAGNAGAVSFPFEALDIIFHYSKGIPRLINIICDFLMLSAFADETRAISVEMVHDIIGDLDFENHYWSSSVAEKDKSIQSGCNNSSSSDLPQEVYTILQGISRRIDSLEKDLAGSVQSALKDFHDSIVFIHNFKTHVGRTDSQIADLCTKIEEIKKMVERDNALVEQNNPTNVGFVRRVFGGDTFPK